MAIIGGDDRVIQYYGIELYPLKSFARYEAKAFMVVSTAQANVLGITQIKSLWLCMVEL